VQVGGFRAAAGNVCTSRIAEQVFSVQTRRVITWENSVFLRPGGRSAYPH
jgi:hypothetical protein